MNNKVVKLQSPLKRLNYLLQLYILQNTLRNLSVT